METLSEVHDDSSGAYPSSVKSEDGSRSPDGDRSSPPPNCAICLGRCRNKSFTDSCLHQFCFKCLVTWSKVKTECPLCKQNFKSIIHNVQSNQQYEEYRVEQRLQEEDRIDIDDLVTATRRFRYRTTLTFPRGGDHIALQRLLMHYPPLSAMVGMSRDLPRELQRDLPGIVPAALPSSRRRRSPSSFRRTVYRHNLWARPLPDFTGRHRDCTPEFYRYNDSQMHRLVPWLNRELHYLLLENAGHIAYVLSRILELLPQCHITSPEFRNEVYRYFGSRTDHFLHELHCFASTPYDLTGYDRNVQYTTDSRISNTTNDVISSSDTESGDSDIVLVNPTAQRPPPAQPASPYDTNPGPSVRRGPDFVTPRGQVDMMSEAGRDIVIETISHSDSDDDDVMVTGYIKPPHQRTPEVVDLRDSDDSDVVVTESRSDELHRLVRMTLGRVRPSGDSGEASRTPPPPRAPRARRRRRSSSSYCPSSECAAPCCTCSTAASSDDSSAARKVASPVRRNKRKRTRRSRDAERGVATAAPPPLPSLPARAPAVPASEEIPERDRREKDKRKKSKSTNGKGVKSSRRVDAAPSSRTELASVLEEPRPGPSSRPDGRGSSRSSRRDDATDSKAPESMSAQEEPRPGPSSSSSRPAGKVGRSSRRGDPTDSKATESTSVQEEIRLGPSSSRPAKKGKRSSRKNDNPESRREESTIEVQEESHPRSSSSRSKGSKSRKDEAKESLKAESTTEARSSSRAGPRGSANKRKNTDDTSARQNSRESKKMKSVVRKTSSWSSAGAGLSSAEAEPGLTVRASSSAAPASSSAAPTSNSAGRASSSAGSTSSMARRASSSAASASSSMGRASNSAAPPFSSAGRSSSSTSRASTSAAPASSSAGRSSSSTSRASNSAAPASSAVGCASSSTGRASSSAAPASSSAAPAPNLVDIGHNLPAPMSALANLAEIAYSLADHTLSSAALETGAAGLMYNTAALAASSAVTDRRRYSSSDSSDDGVSRPGSPDSFTDSDDDIPLNLTIQRSAGHS